MCWPESPSRVQLFATPWTVAHQALLSMGFSRQEYWSGLPCPPPRDLPNPGIEPHLPYCRQILYQLSHIMGMSYGFWNTEKKKERELFLQFSSAVQSCPTLCDCSPQAPLSVGFFRQEYWSELPCPPPRDLPNLGIEPASLMSPALAGIFFTTGATWEAPSHVTSSQIW